MLKPRLSAEWELAKQGEEKECSRLKEQQVQRPVLGRQLGVVRGAGSLWCREGGSGKWLEWRPVRETVVGLLDPLMNSHGPQSCLHLALTCLLLVQKHQDLPFTSTDPRVSVKGSSLFGFLPGHLPCHILQTDDIFHQGQQLADVHPVCRVPAQGRGWHLQSFNQRTNESHISCKSAQVG